LLWSVPLNLPFLGADLSKKDGAVAAENTTSTRS
jgi:hypothetical protein